MVKLVDINPFKKDDSHIRRVENGGGLIKKESWFQRVKNFILSISVKKWVGWLGLLLGLLLVWKLWAIAGVSLPNSFPYIDKNKWQAVFLNNGQAYFGHLKNLKQDYVSLENVYYLKVAQPTQPTQAGSQQFNLVKVENDLHGPEDILYIQKSQISFWENLREDSPVVSSIKSQLKVK